MLVGVLQALDDLMILGVCRSLIQHTDRLSVQQHEVTFETEIIQPSNILVAIGVIVLEEQVDRGGRVPESSIEWELCHIIGPRQIDGLRRFGV